MSDKELLEFAAKAVDIVIVRSRLDDPMNKDFLVENSRRNEFQAAGPWNPLTDDGDALRLAVDLKLFVHLDGDLVEVIGDKSVFERAGYKGCRLSAARRAIVRAAAEIGKAMP
jgi:hypothetical protein